jgi:amino acid transporter
MRVQGHTGHQSMVSLAIIVGAATVGVLAGRAAIVPVVTTASLSIIASYVMTCAAAFRLRRVAATDERPFRVLGGTIVIAATTVSIAAMGIALALRPLFSRKKVPVEWMVLALWIAIAIGLAIWR